LQFFLEQALSSPEKTIVTFGGAYSNHLVATAYACQQLGLKCIGLVRGEKPSNLSHTLQYCASLEMELHYLSRTDYQQQANTGTTAFKGTVVPEGGYHPLGAKGAADIMQLFPQIAPTHIITATGTGTTLAGLLMNKKEGQTIISVPVIKGMHDLDERLHYLLSTTIVPAFEIWPDAHEGGYAKHNPELIAWMNQFYEQHQIPTDVVYTGKMMKAVFQKIEEKYFKPGSSICCIHTGGLQGNLSFAKDSFIF
jgi:1-aminocyclopropane-1-carboxylate deaminase